MGRNEQEWTGMGSNYLFLPIPAHSCSFLSIPAIHGFTVSLQLIPNSTQTHAILRTNVDLQVISLYESLFEQ